MSTFKIPAGYLADDETLKRNREELKKNLLEHKKISIAPTSNVTTGINAGKDITIPAGKLAAENRTLKKGAFKIPVTYLADDDAALKLKREELKKKLLEGKKIPITSTGSVTTETDTGKSIFIPAGKLAVYQWYEKDPSLLVAEKAAMQHAFPHFQFEKLDDGRLAWTGALNVGILGDNSWYIMAVYNNNHPQQVMGSSVRVYLVEPDINELINGLGWSPTHLLRDSNNQVYVCTAEAGNIKTGKEVTSAASVIAWAVKWLMAFELVLTGDLSKEKFNEHGGI
jgi:hypothetical protein